MMLLKTIRFSSPVTVRLKNASNKFLSIHVVPAYLAFLPVLRFLYAYQRLILVFLNSLQSDAQLHDDPIRLKP